MTHVIIPKLEKVSEYIEQNILSADGRVFEAQETSIFDYKDQFPFSLSDEYFLGIVKLICALHNTYGGFIVFGVHDKTRTPGHNKVKINIERLNNVLRQKLTSPIECVYFPIVLHAYDDNANGQVDIIMIPRRSQTTPPVRFGKVEGKFRPSQIFLRRSHETLEARSADLPFLFGRRQYQDMSSDAESLSQPIRAILPPSPATMRTFVGRLLTLERLWNWLFQEDEPRLFLYGKGGTGKSTIAFEFARLVSQNGSGICTSSGNPLNCIIYLSAKRREVVPERGVVVDTKCRDFSDSQSLFLAILYYAEWTDDEFGAAATEKYIEGYLKELFNARCILLIIDDIDTLTTQGVDAGFDTLFAILARSKGGSKVLYTLRNAPTHSLKNSIEIPGLDLENEYSEFVSNCCVQFRQPEPPKPVLEGRLSQVTERIPLLLEVIVGLRRTCGNYDDAIDLFERQSGEDVRRYLFEREYSSLPPDNKARYLLAALSLFEDPVSADDLQVVLRFDKEQVREALGNIDEIFLQKSLSREKEDTFYSLSGVTKAYIASKREKLERLFTLRATVTTYHRSIHPNEKEIARLRFKVEMCTRRGECVEALRLLEDTTLSAKITQHPDFQVLLGVVYANQLPPRVDKARTCFQYCADMRFEHVEGMREWYNMELRSGYGLENAVEVCNYVISGKRYSPREKGEFFAKRGYIYELLGKKEYFTNKEKSLRHFANSLRSQLIAYDILSCHSSLDTNKNRTWIARCLTSLFNKCQDGALLDILQVVSEVVCNRSDEVGREILADPLLEPLDWYFQLLGRRRGQVSRSEASGLCKKIQNMLRSGRALSFDENESKDKILSSISSCIANLEARA